VSVQVLVSNCSYPIWRHEPGGGATGLRARPAAMACCKRVPVCTCVCVCVRACVCTCMLGCCVSLPSDVPACKRIAFYVK